MAEGPVPRGGGLTRTLLIDADIIAYRHSASNESKIDWGDGVVSHTADLKAAKRAARDEIEFLVEKLEATDLIICLSDDVQNFRNTVYPPYKTNRTSTERPQHLYDMKEWLGQKYPSQLRPRLEADDVMGILATEPHEGERIIVSADKDMQTIPSLLYNPNKPDLGVRLITPEQAERFMLWQAITGDKTDGYPGCPGSGPAAADKLLDGQGWESFSHEFRSGPRKGTVETRWRVKEMDRWSAIVSAYEKAGLNERDAIVQVNCARILKHSDVDGNWVIPWTPSMLKYGRGN